MYMALPIPRPRKRKNTSRPILLNPDLSSEAGVDIVIGRGAHTWSWAVHERTSIVGSGQRRDFDGS